jgi:hypothetical protein
MKLFKSTVILVALFSGCAVAQDDLRGYYEDGASELAGRACLRSGIYWIGPR